MLCRNNSVFYRFFLYTASVIAKEVEAARNTRVAIIRVYYAYRAQE